MSSISTEAKVGLFVLGGIDNPGVHVVHGGTKRFGLKKGYYISVLFDNVRVWKRTRRSKSPAWK